MTKGGRGLCCMCVCTDMLNCHQLYLKKSIPVIMCCTNVPVIELKNNDCVCTGPEGNRLLWSALTNTNGYSQNSDSVWDIILFNEEVNTVVMKWIPPERRDEPATHHVLKSLIIWSLYLPSVCVWNIIDTNHLSPLQLWRWSLWYEARGNSPKISTGRTQVCMTSLFCIENASESFRCGLTKWDFCVNEQTFLNKGKRKFYILSWFTAIARYCSRYSCIFYQNNIWKIRSICKPKDSPDWLSNRNRTGKLFRERRPVDHWTIRDTSKSFKLYWLFQERVRCSCMFIVTAIEWKSPANENIIYWLCTTSYTLVSTINVEISDGWQVITPFHLEAGRAISLHN